MEIPNSLRALLTCILTKDFIFMLLKIMIVRLKRANYWLLSKCLHKKISYISCRIKFKIMDAGTLKHFISENMPLLILLIVWEAAWKLLAMWKAGRDNQAAWFVCIALINSAGILPIIYLIARRKKLQSH